LLGRRDRSSSSARAIIRRATRSADSAMSLDRFGKAACAER